MAVLIGNILPENFYFATYVIALPARGGAGGLKRHFRGRRHQGLCYTFGRGTRRPYPTEVVIVRRELSGGQVRYFAYAVYGLGGVRWGRVFEYYRRRFSIESG